MGMERLALTTTRNMGVDGSASWMVVHLRHFEEAKSLLRRTIPVARRVLGENKELTLAFRSNYGIALYRDELATIDDLREAVTTLEDTARTARRVLGGAHPRTTRIRTSLREARTVLRVRSDGGQVKIV